MKHLFNILFRNKNIPAHSELGQLSASLRFNKFLSLALLVLVFYSVSQAKKPPLVIRYTSSDVIVEKGFENNTSISDFDVKLFIKHFLEKVNLFDSYAISNNLPEALNMMSPKLRSYYKTSVVTDSILKEVINLGTKSYINIQDTTIDQKNDHISVTVIYNREIIPFDSEQSEIIPLRAEIVIEVLEQRSEKYPYGLRILKFKEFKIG